MTSMGDYTTAFTPDRYVSIFEAKYLSDRFLFYKAKEIESKITSQKYIMTNTCSAEEENEFSLNKEYIEDFVKNVYENSYIIADNLFNLFNKVSFSKISFNLFVIATKDSVKKYPFNRDTISNYVVFLNPINFEYSNENDYNILDNYIKTFEQGYVNLRALEDALTHLDLSYEIIVHDQNGCEIEKLDTLNMIDEKILNGSSVYFKIYSKSKVRIKK